MSHPNNTIIYDLILEDEEWVNKQWNKFDQTSKIEILQKAGLDLFEIYNKEKIETLDEGNTE